MTLIFWPDLPKKESDVTQGSKLVPTKTDFCGTGIAQKGNDRLFRFGQSYRYSAGITKSRDYREDSSRFEPMADDIDHQN